MILWKIFVLFCVLHWSDAVYELNDEDFERMPPVVYTELYEPCLRRRGGRYCSAYGALVADGHSPLLKMMQDYSADTSKRYNHTRIFFGKCVSQCEKEGETISDPRELLEACLNRTVWEQYQLKVKVEEEVFCNEHGKTKLSFGTAEVVVTAVVIALLLCNIVGSLCDVFCPSILSNGRVGKILQCFSISRNWKALITPAEQKDTLKSIYGVRSVNMLMVVVGHSIMPAIVAPADTRFIERKYDLPLFHTTLNSTLMMQTFLFLSAFLLVHSSRAQQARPWSQLLRGIWKRWLRLSRPYLLVMALTATWLPRAGTGPLWDSMVMKECNSCRRDWWMHVLYINNYLRGTYCMLHTWYLAADMQLYCVGLAIHAFCRGRRLHLTLGVLFFLSLLAPALHVYFQDLDGILVCSPTSIAEIFETDPTFHTLYTLAHNNLGSFVLGLAAAYWLKHLQENNFDASKYKAWRPLYWLLFPALLAIPTYCQVHYSAPRASLLHRALAAALVKPLYGAVVGALIMGMILRVEDIYRGVMEWPGWVPLSRVSYCMFLVHVAYIYAMRGSMHRPLHLDHLTTLEMVLSTVLLSFVAGTIFYLTVEEPLAQLYNIKTTSDKQTEKIKQNGKEK